LSGTERKIAMEREKNILCFGDSNTWGYNPANGCRHPRDKRWTGLLGQELGRGWRVIEEGCNGRTTVFDDPVTYGSVRNGLCFLPTCLASQKPLDLVILMLGTNDLKLRHSATPEDISKGMARLVRAVQAMPECGVDGHAPAILVVSPLHIGPTIDRSSFGDEFGGQSAAQRSHRLAGYYEQVARQWGCAFMDASLVAQPSPLDALHMDEAGHAAFARAMAARVRQLLA